MTIRTGSFDKLDHTKANALDNELLTAIARSAQDLTTGRGWPDGVNALLEDLGKITKVSRVWIFQTLELQENYVIQDYAFEWAARNEYIQIGLPSFNRFKTKIDNSEYKKLIASRMNAEYQQVITSELSQSFLKDNLSGQNIRSMLTIPIFVENSWWGTLGFDDCERCQEWSASEIALLRTAGFLIASAILRDSLSAKKRQLEVLGNITSFSAWELDIRRGHLWCTSELLSETPEKSNNLQFSFRQWIKLIHPKQRKMFFTSVRQFINQKLHSFNCDIQVATGKGCYRWVEVSAKIDKRDKSRGDVIAGVLVDINQRKSEEEKLRHEAKTDPLTGAFNRREIESLINFHIKRYKKNQETFSLIFLDLDHFKKINDTHGHSMGDKILCHFVEQCQSVLRSVDVFSRIGGEEFAILLPYTNEKEVFSIGSRICQMIQNAPYMQEEESIFYSVSVGCYTVKDESLHQQEIFERADKALYLAKQSGRNQVKVI